MGSSPIVITNDSLLYSAHIHTTKHQTNKNLYNKLSNWEYGAAVAQWTVNPSVVSSNLTIPANNTL